MELELEELELELEELEKLELEEEEAKWGRRRVQRSFAAACVLLCLLLLAGWMVRW